MDHLKIYLPFKSQPHKMVKHSQTIGRQRSMNCLNVFNHFVGLVLKGLIDGCSNDFWDIRSKLIPLNLLINISGKIWSLSLKLQPCEEK